MVASIFHENLTPYIHNIYGPTECSVFVTDFVIDELSENRVPIGAPVYNTGIYILNNKNELVKPGELGEICIEGDQVFKRYINKPYTNESFCKNPYTQKKCIGQEILEHIYLMGI